MMRCARCWSFQRLGSSDSLFSSASRRVAASTSKMPPQQPHGLPDFLDKALYFCAHRFFPGSIVPPCSLPQPALQPSSPTAAGNRCEAGTMGPNHELTSRACALLTITKNEDNHGPI